VTDPQRYRGGAITRFVEFARSWTGRRTTAVPRPK